MATEIDLQFGGNMKRLNLDDPNVWNRWRELYYELTHEENIQFGNDIFERYPGQASFNPAVAEAALDLHECPRVLEVGGWRGELAHHCFQKREISSWHNIDMCKAAVDATIPDLSLHPYKATFPASFDWFRTEERQEEYDIAISAHSIEHLTDSHLCDLIQYLNGIPIIAFEAPIARGRTDWKGYQGTHILSMGWDLIDHEMNRRNYKPTKVTDWGYIYKRQA